MSDKKHIDRLFQEKFKDFDVEPNDSVWENIEAKLNQEKKQRRIIPIWWQFGGVAAALLLLFAIGNTIFETNKANVPAVVDTKKDKKSLNEDFDTNESVISNSEQTQKENISNLDNVVEKSDLVSNTSKDKTNTSENHTSKNKTLSSEEKSVVTDNLNRNTKSVAKNGKSLTTHHSELSQKNTISHFEEHPKNSENSSSNGLLLKSEKEINRLLKSNSSSDAVVKSDQNSSSGLDTNPEVNSELTLKEKEDTVNETIEDAIAEAEDIEKTNEEEKERRRWSIAPNVAPVYFNSLGKGSSIDPQFSNNNMTSDINMSYGLKGSYAINKRLKITAGVNRVNFSNTTNDVIAMSDNAFSSSVVTNSGRLENINLKSGLDHTSLTLMSRTSISSSAPESIKTIETGDLEQRFGFIEIPLEVEYRLIDKKIGVNVSSGFSTLLLNENEIFADVNGENTAIGEANNINQTSFSANFGFGIDYNLSEKLNINLEPKFKYQLNTFNNTSGDFRPFFIGVYTGLNFKF